MKIHTISIIKNLRYTKLSDLYTYYYICLEESFMDLKDNTDDLENIKTLIKEKLSDTSLAITTNVLFKYFNNNNIDIISQDNNILLISIQNDPENEDLNKFINYLNFNGYHESCFENKKN